LSALYTFAILGICAVTAAIIVLVSGLLREANKIAQEWTKLAKTVNDDLVPAVTKAASTMSDAGELLAQVSRTVDRVDRVAAVGERLMDSAHVATAATKAVKSTATELISVYEGVKQGIKSLRG